MNTKFMLLIKMMRTIGFNKLYTVSKQLREQEKIILFSIFKLLLAGEI